MEGGVKEARKAENPVLGPEWAVLLEAGRREEGPHCFRGSSGTMQLTSPQDGFLSLPCLQLESSVGLWPADKGREEGGVAKRAEQEGLVWEMRA